MVILFRSVLSILIIFLIAIGSYADDNAPKIEQLSKHFRMEKPEGEGPFPAVMLVPGCSGFEFPTMKSQYDRVQSILSELGFVTLRVDHLAVRNATSCMSMSLNPEVVAGDITRVTDYLRQQDYVKKNALNVIGWSFGGACTLQALRETPNRKPAEVNAAIVYYPVCSFLSSGNWFTEVPVLALFGAADHTAPFGSCKNLFSELPRSDTVTVRIYDDAYHCFDNSDSPAAKSAWLEVTNFLHR